VTDNPLAIVSPSSYDTPPSVLLQEQRWPVRPLSKALAEARMAKGDQWNKPGHSYFRDLLTVADNESRIDRALETAPVLGGIGVAPSSAIAEQQGGLEGAMRRLTEASRKVESTLRALRPDVMPSFEEQRAMTTAAGSGVGLIPANGVPIDVASMFADLARAKAVLANELLQGELPPYGNTVQVGRASTGAAVAVQSAEGGADSDSSEVTLFASSPLATISGKVDVSRQLIDRGINADREIAASLGAAYGAALEQQVINGSGSAGQLTGLLGVSGITANTVATATNVVVATAVFKLVSDTATAYAGPVDALVMHPRRRAWLLNSHDTTAVYGAPPFVQRIIETAGMPTTLGGGTEDAILALVLAETPIFISPPRISVREDVLSGTMQVRIQATSYVAMVGARQPTSIGKLTGAGLAAPSFA
jgi:HK97 family phage major capsid protein